MWIENRSIYLGNFIGDFFDFWLSLCLGFFQDILQHRSNSRSNRVILHTIFNRFASSFKPSIRFLAESKISSWRIFKSFSNCANVAALSSSNWLINLQTKNPLLSAMNSRYLLHEFFLVIFIHCCWFFLCIIEEMLLLNLCFMNDLLNTRSNRFGNLIISPSRIFIHLCMCWT